MSVIRPRSAWTSVPPRSVTPQTPTDLAGIVVHWFGSPLSPSNAESVPAVLESVRRTHTAPGGLGVKGGGSDIGYNFAADQWGGKWTLRGLTARTGANGNADANRDYLAIVGILGKGQKPTDLMLKALHDLVAAARAAGVGRALRTHGSITGSECPGPELTAWTNKGGPAPDAVNPTPWPIPLPAWWWVWARWFLGHGEYNPCGPRFMPARCSTGAPERIPDWAWARLDAFLGA